MCSCLCNQLTSTCDDYTTVQRICHEHVMTIQVCDYSDDDRRQYDLDSLKIDPIIVHLVTVNGSQWPAAVAQSGTDSNLSHRALLVVAQIMDLDLGNESDAHLAESLLQQDKEDGPGGSEVMIETSADSKMQEEIQEFYAWLDEGSNAMAEAGARERNNDSAGVTEVEVIVEAGGHEINDGAASVTANSGNTSKTKETGQKRKRYYFSAVQTTFLEAQLKDNKLQTPEDRRKVADVFTKETKETFDVEKIHTWFRNHKTKLQRESV